MYGVVPPSLIEQTHMAAARALAEVKRVRTPKMRYTPILKYPYASVLSQIERLFAQPGFAEHIEHWRHLPSEEKVLRDPYAAGIWNDFQTIEVPDEKEPERTETVPFLAAAGNLVFQLNWDGFQPHNRSQKTTEGLYAMCLNLPAHLRFSLSLSLRYAVHSRLSASVQKQAGVYDSPRGHRA